jgi:competence protein ComEA
MMKAAALLLLVINLNTATIKELETLPGIGPALAKRIVEFREKRHGFKRVEELLAIRGISEKKWKAIRDQVEVKEKK